jgi:NitT/TauT family transport system substrate-binding protein
MARRRTTLISAVVAVLALSGCGGSDAEATGDGEIAEFDMLLPFQDSVVWAGYEIAKAQYYPDLGIKPNTRAVSGNLPTIQQLLAGQVPFAVSAGPELIVAASQGHDLVSIANLNQDLFAIGAAPDSGITRLEDLEGRNLGIVDVGDGAIPLVYAALRDVGLEPNEDVNLVVIGDGGPASLAAIEGGEVDAYASTIVDLAVIEQGGVKLTPILPEKYKGIPNNELVVTRETLDDPDMLQRVINLAAGWFKGTLHANESPDEAFATICEVVPADCRDEKLGRALFETVVSLELTQAKSGGAHDPAKYQMIKDLIVDPNAVGPQDVDLESVFTNDYLDEIQSAMK